MEWEYSAGFSDNQSSLTPLIVVWEAWRTNHMHEQEAMHTGGALSGHVGRSGCRACIFRSAYCSESLAKDFFPGEKPCRLPTQMFVEAECGRIVRIGYQLDAFGTF